MEREGTLIVAQNKATLDSFCDVKAIPPSYQGTHRRDGAGKELLAHKERQMSITNQLVVFDPSSLDDLKQISGSALRVLFLTSLTFGDYVAMTQGQVGDALRLDRSAVSRAFGELGNRGLVKKLGHTLYRMCPVVALIPPQRCADFAPRLGLGLGR